MRSILRTTAILRQTTTQKQLFPATRYFSGSSIMSAAVEPGSPPPPSPSGSASASGSKSSARIPGPVESSMQTKVRLFDSYISLTSPPLECPSPIQDLEFTFCRGGSPGAVGILELLIIRLSLLELWGIDGYENVSGDEADSISWWKRSNPP